MTVMASFNSWNGDKIHGSSELLTRLLRDELGFNGFVVSDWNGIGQVAGCEPDNCVQAINAGIDMVMVPKDWRTLLHNMIEQVQAGAITEARIDEAVSRILKVKIQSGLMERGLPSKRPLLIRMPLALRPTESWREAVRRSLVMKIPAASCHWIQPGPTESRALGRTISACNRWLDDQLAGHWERECRFPEWRRY